MASVGDQGGVGDGVGGVDHRGGVDHGGSVDNRGGVVGRGNSVSNGLRVGSGAIVGDLSDVAVDGVGVVVDVLDPAVGKSNGVGALGVTGTVAALSGVEVGARVVVGDSVLVGVGGNLVGVDLSNSVNSMGNRGMVSGGSMDHRGVVGRGGDSMNHRGGNSMSHSVSNKTVSSNKSMANNTVASSVENVGPLSNSSY